MYLKKIEAFGFKSFANKTVLEFNQGIMGIVGPNGSGKSNVADAVRWVLGEQSAKQLRGSSMQDVIFSGTENRKPQGYASVALTIDNSDHLLAVDYDEVVVSRRVYRSGESEYMLNGQICRLRDVQEIFYDTGVGKEGYSIIGQGQIDRILNGKPEDRRELFDEAAGIVKYKKRKLITQKKLETEEGNLVRVTDILRELERQVGPLERQSEKAKTYLKLKDELRQADLAAFRLESSDYQRRLSEAEKNLAIVEADRQETGAKAAAMKERYDILSEQLSTLEESRDSIQEEVSRRKVHRESLEGEIRILMEQLQSAKEREKQMRDRLARLDTELAEHQEEYLRIRKEKQSLVQEEGALAAEAEASAQELEDTERDLERLKQRQADLKTQQLSALDEKASLAAGLQRTETLKEQAEARLSELKTQGDDSHKVREEIAEKIREIRFTLKQTEDQEKVERNRLQTARKQEESARAQLGNANEKLAQTQQRFHAVKSRRDSLINIAERYEGYGNSVRKIMEQKETRRGIRGVVADLFHTSQKYETAIETALGGRIQNVVVDTEKDAKELIAWLKEQRLGRATFLPLQSVHGREGIPRPEAQSEPGVMGIASALIQTEERYKDIAAYLLGRYLVVDTVDHALAIAAKYRYSLNLVTLEGELLSPGGAITGGSYRNNSNLLGRRREIDDLSGRMEMLQKQVTAGREEVVRLEEMIQSAAALQEEARKQLHRLDLVRNTATMDLNQQTSFAEELKKSHGEREEEEKLLQKHIREWEKEKDQSASQLQELEENMQKWEAEEKQAAVSWEQKQNEHEILTARLAETRQKADTLKQKTDFLTANQDRILREKEQLTGEYQELSEALEGGDQKNEEKTASIADLREESRKEAEICAQLDEKLSGSNARRDQLSEEQKQIFADRETLNERMTSLDREYFRLENSQERLTEQINKLVDYIWTEYEMTPSEAEKAAPEGEKLTLAESRRAVNRTKQQIRELGPVNVNAIEEYKEVSERYVFMRDQHEDLVKAADSLKKIIKDLETGMRTQFAENFARIQEEFARVFQELFGGGKGRLELAEAEDILDAGIIINAQPPGKKLVNMMQLSGGEKALSAIALLFAIQNLKPSPFCLLDEIEAALDEPNVDRYAAYLNKLKDHTQFIVITHRRGTMEMADRLYGITMQEKGVSVLVSVDLTDPALTE